MSTYRHGGFGYISISLLLALLLSSSAAMAQTDSGAIQITVLYDAFGKTSAMERDWGYSAFIEYRGKRILFDTGNDPAILARNAKAKDVDLSRLDFVVMSHRHGDHMGGMQHLLRVNPKVKIYAPKENFGIYGSSLPSGFYRRDDSLSSDERYYSGSAPPTMTFGSAWPDANFELVDETAEIAPGVHLIALVSDTPGTVELLELSLAIATPDGLVLIVGCSHPGIENIVATAAKLEPQIHLIAGGLHLVTAKDADIERVAKALNETWKVNYIAPGHCTGEPSFAALKKVFRNRYLFAGLGTRLLVGARATVAATHLLLPSLEPVLEQSCRTSRNC